MAKVRLKFDIFKADGSYINPAGIISNVVWSGDKKSPSRTLSFNLIKPIFDDSINLKVELGDMIKMFINYNDGGYKEEFRGRIVNINKKSDGTWSCVAKDYGMFLNNKVAMNINNMKTEDVAKAVIKNIAKDNKIVAGDIIKTGKKYTKIVTDSTAYEVIQAAYTEASKATKKQYMTKVKLDKVSVIEKGKEVINLAFAEGHNIFDSSYSQSIENMVNKVMVTDENGNIIDTKVDKEMVKLYQITMNAIQNKQNGGTEFVKPDQKVTLNGVGHLYLQTGVAVHVKDTASGLTGIFYVDSDKHDFEQNGYTTSADLNFENVMDEHEITENKSESNGGSAGGSGSGALVGKRVKALFTAYCPKAEGAIGGGNSTASGEAINYNKKTCAAPKSVPFQSNVQILGTGSKYDGQVYRVNDRGGKVNIVNGVYHFDMLVGSKAEMDAFGTKRGEAIIGSPGTPQYESSGGASGKARDIASIAEREVGNGENGKNRTKYGAWYGMNGQPWCAMFVSWCANQAGVPTSVIPKYASCSAGASWFKSRGRWQGRNYKPKVGDIIFFTKSHTGIVTSVSGNSFGTVEGNSTHDKVARHTYSVGNSGILGFGTPAY